MEKRYRVTLTESERGDLRKLVSVGKAAAPKLVRARILLLADQSEGGSSKPDLEIVESLGCGRASVERVRKRFVEDGLEAALNRKPYSNKNRVKKINGDEEAHLVALCCSKPPEGRIRWTLKLLASILVEMEIVESVSPSTVGRALKKTS